MKPLRIPVTHLLAFPCLAVVLTSCAGTSARRPAMPDRPFVT